MLYAYRNGRTYLAKSNFNKIRATKIWSKRLLERGICIRLMMKELISKKELKEFGYIIAFGFPLLIGIIIPLVTGHSLKLWTLFISIIFLILGIFKPRLLFYPYKLWMGIGDFLGFINSGIILWLVYIFVLIPIAFAMRLFGYDPLKQKTKNLKTFKEYKTNSSFQ